MGHDIVGYSPSHPLTSNPAPPSGSDVAAALGRMSSQAAPTRAELINMGLLYALEHGYAAFTVPQFDRFLKWAIPVLSISPVQRRTK